MPFNMKVSSGGLFFLMNREQIRKWQHIIWREWRYCSNKGYAAHLFELVADGPVGWGAKITLILLNMLAGMAVALLLGFVVSSDWLILRQFVWAGSVVGGIRGYLVGRELSWRTWLARLSFNLPAPNPRHGVGAALGLLLAGGLVFGPFFWVVLAGLFWVLGGLIKRLNRGQDAKENPFEYQAWYFWWRKRPQAAELNTALENILQAKRLSPPAQKALGIVSNSEARPASDIELLKLKNYVQTARSRAQHLPPSSLSRNRPGPGL